MPPLRSLLDALRRATAPSPAAEAIDLRQTKLDVRPPRLEQGRPPRVGAGFWLGAKRQRQGRDGARSTAGEVIVYGLGDAPPAVEREDFAPDLVYQARTAQLVGDEREGVVGDLDALHAMAERGDVRGSIEYQRWVGRATIPAVGFE